MGPFARRSRFPKTLRGKAALTLEGFRCSPASLGGLSPNCPAKLRCLLRSGKSRFLNFLQYRAGSSEVRQWRSKSRTNERSSSDENFYRLQFGYGATDRNWPSDEGRVGRVETAEETKIRAENLI